jgi:hypothetical protein
MDEKYLVKFGKTYKFENQEYNEIDLVGIESLTGEDLESADREFIKSGQVATVNEMSIGYANIIAARVTGKPIEFFKHLPAPESIKVKNMVSGFFYEMD